MVCLLTHWWAPLPSSPTPQAWCSFCLAVMSCWTLRLWVSVLETVSGVENKF